MSPAKKKTFLPEELVPVNASIRALNTVKITSTGMNFDAPDEIPSGCSTFSYMNKTAGPHFFILVKLPEGKTIEDYRAEVTVPFNNLLKTWRGVEIAEEEAQLAQWFGPHLFKGGSGIIDSGKTAVTALNLEPGNYVIECYIKMPNGDFHSLMGMLEPITVTNEVSKSKKIKADINISIDPTGLYLNDEIKRPGLHTFSVDFAPETDADVHLVKIENPDNADREKLKQWIHWATNVGQENEGLMTPAPEGFSFLGGSQEFYDDKDSKTYFQAVLEPGTYALISEVFYHLVEGYYVEFTVE